MAREALQETAAQRQLRRLDQAGVLADGGLRAEIIAGELVVRGDPRWRHQEIVTRVGAWLFAWTPAHGGHAAVGPVGVELDPDHVVRPDVIFVRAERVHLIEDDRLHAAPDLVVEVASPGTKSLDLVEKRTIYERLRVAEYWVIDPDAEQVLVHRLGEGGYGKPEILEGDATLEPLAAPGLRKTVTELLGAPRA